MISSLKCLFICALLTAPPQAQGTHQLQSELRRTPIQLARRPLGQVQIQPLAEIHAAHHEQGGKRNLCE